MILNIHTNLQPPLYLGQMVVINNIYLVNFEDYWCWWEDSQQSQTGLDLLHLGLGGGDLSSVEQLQHAPQGSAWHWQA